MLRSVLQLQLAAWRVLGPNSLARKASGLKLSGPSRAIHSRAPRVPKSSGNLKNEEGASATVAAGDIATTWQPLQFLSSATSVPLVINNKTLRFPLPDGQVTPVDKWGSEDRAPSLNRKQLLFSMLNGAYRNWTKKAPKEFYAIQTMHRGNGKNRLQLEWIYQALNKPKVIKSFLDTDKYTPEELKSRKIFINMLYEAAFVQRIIITLGSNVNPSINYEDQDIVLMEIILDSIRKRFTNQTIQFDGKSLSITKELLDHFVEKFYLRDSILLFNALVDQFCIPPSELPFDVEFDRTKARKMLILGLDECQDYSNKRIDKDKPDLVYQLLKYTSQNLPALDHQINTSVFWLVTGTVGQYNLPHLDGSVYLLDA